MTGDPQCVIVNCASAGTSESYVAIRDVTSNKTVASSIGMYLPTSHMNAARPVYLAGFQKLMTYGGNPQNFFSAPYGSLLLTSANKTGQCAYLKDTDSTKNYGWTPIIPRFAYKNTWAPGDIAAGAYVTTTVNVVDAVVGEAVAVGFVGMQAGLQLEGWVSSAGIVTVQLRNSTGASITPTPGTLNVRVFGNPLKA